MHPGRMAALLVQEASDEVLMMSRKNMHILGMDSIVLAKRPDGRLVRMYLCKTHALVENGLTTAPLVLGIHNHRYDLNLHLVYGKVVNHVFWRGVGSPGYGRRLYDKFTFSPFNSQQGAAAHIEGEEWLSPLSSQVLVAGECVYMDHRALHTVQVAYDSAWIVEEKMHYPQKAVTLYSQGTPDLGQDLYQEFKNPTEVRETALWWLEANA